MVLKCPLILHLKPVSTHIQTINLYRLASTSSSGLYPFPAHRHPKPHEIFHLPSNATLQEIKCRYIDLVRAHHPDSTLCSHVPPAERHARFQAISAAYDHLRKRKTVNLSGLSYDDQLHEEVRRRTRGAHYKRDELEERSPETDYAADIVPIIFGALLIFVATMPGLDSAPGATSRSASVNLAEARREAQIFGEERRSEIRRQAYKSRLAREEEERSRSHSCLNVGRFDKDT